MNMISPITIWISWVIRSAVLRIHNRGRHLRIGYMAKIRRCDFGYWNTLYDDTVLTDVSLGDMSYVARGTRIANATVGRFTCIGPEVLIGLGRHPSRDFVSSHPAFYSIHEQSQVTYVGTQKFEEFRPIAIGNDVWIGARAMILDGAIIGDGAIIAAGAVVLGEVPPYAVVGGVPAKLLRYRFDDATTTALRESRWWERPLDDLRRHVDDFANVEAFLRWQSNESQPGSAGEI